MAGNEQRQFGLMHRLVSVSLSDHGHGDVIWEFQN